MTEISIPSTLPLRERLPSYAARLEKIEAHYARWQTRKEKDLKHQLKRELGMVGLLSNQVSAPLENECYIVSREPYDRNHTIQTTHLAWDLGAESISDTDGYEPHLYLTRSNQRFYRGDQGLALPTDPVASYGLLHRVRTLRQQLEP